MSKLINKESNCSLFPDEVFSSEVLEDYSEYSDVAEVSCLAKPSKVLYTILYIPVSSLSFQNSTQQCRIQKMYKLYVFLYILFPLIILNTVQYIFSVHLLGFDFDYQMDIQNSLFRITHYVLSHILHLICCCLTLFCR